MKSLREVAVRARLKASVDSAKELFRKARLKTKEESAARGSRGVTMSAGYIYFLVLESSWGFCGLMSVIMYGVAIVICTAMSYPVDVVNTTADMESDAGKAEATKFMLAIRYATAHVITMGFGTVYPASDAAYAVAYLSQLAGVIVNVFVFAAVLAKFQKPQADLVWCARAVICKRDGIPTLLIRVANLRCHTLFNPTIRATLLTRHVTDEGEGYMRKDELEVPQPSTISGVHTIAHTIDESSALYAHMYAVMDDDSDDEEEHWLLHVTFTATDPIYGADLSAVTTYDKDGVLQDSRFADVIQTGSNGKAYIDWANFDHIIPALESSPVASPLSALTQSPADDLNTSSHDSTKNATTSLANAKEQHTETNKTQTTTANYENPEDDPLWPFPLPPPPPITPPMAGVPRKAVLSHRASYGAGAVVDGESPLGPLVPFCPYCMRLGLILAEARVPFETYMIDSTNKASWFLEAFPAGTTPAIQGTPGGTSTGEWVGEFETILKNASDQNPQVAAVARVRNTALTVERVQALGGAMSYGLWLTLVAESTCESASGFIAFTRGGAGLEEVSGESGASLRDRAIEGALSALREAESAVSSCAGPFLAGDAPDLVDVYLSSMLHFSRICLEIGLHKLPQGACSLADLGCPSLQRYLEAWVKRESWGYSYKSTSLDENSAASARVAADMIATSAPDVCGEDVMYPVMCRARRRDSAYQKAIRAVLMPTMPTDMGDVASLTSKEAPTSESDATSSKKESVSLSSDTRTESNDKASSKSLATAPVVGVPVPLDAASRNSGEQASVSGAVSAKKVLKRRKSMKSKSKTNAAICI